MRVGVVVVGATALALFLGDFPPIRISGWLCVVLAVLPVFWVERTSLALVAAAVASSLGTVAVLLERPYGMMDVRNDGAALLIWCTIEVVALCALSLRHGRFGVVLVIAAAGLIGLRLVPGDVLGVQLFIASLCASSVVGANVLGRYLRAQDRQREQAIRAARLRQQRELALDLHDFVAHEIAAISVAAQAARVVGGEAGLASLEPIQAAAGRAMAKLEQSIEALSQPASEIQLPGVADIGALASRFEGPVELVDGVTGRYDLPSAVQYTAYRVVVEGLNNVRRHAPATPAVTVTLDVVDGRLRVCVHNRPEPDAFATWPGTGLGLAGLTERLASLGGTLDAVPDGEGGWSLTARLPIVEQRDGTADGERRHRR